MSPLWTSAEIAAATDGVANAHFECTGVAFDSREIGPGALRRLGPVSGVKAGSDAPLLSAAGSRAVVAWVTAVDRRTTLRGPLMLAEWHR